MKKHFYKIIFVADSEKNSDQVNAVLNDSIESWFEFHSVTSISQAKASIQLSNADVLLLDVKAGKSLLEAGHSALSHLQISLPVIIFTDSPNFFNDLPKSTFYNFIWKERFDPYIFMYTVRYAIERQSTSDEYHKGLSHQKMLNSLMRFSLLNTPLNDTMREFLVELLSNDFMSIGNRGAVYVLDRSYDKFLLTASIGFPEDLGTPRRALVFNSGFEKVILGNNYQKLDNLRTYTEIEDEFDAFDGNFYLIPITNNKLLRGFVLLEVDNNYFYNTNELSFLSAASNTLAMVIERKWIERELRILSNVVDQNPSAVIITDTDGRIEYANSRYFEMTGYSNDDIIGVNATNLENVQRFRDVYTNVLNSMSSGRNWHSEIQSYRKDGTHFWEHATFAPIRDTSGRITNYLKISEDITERKKTENALRESEERYRTLVNNINEYIYSVIYSYADVVQSYHSPKCFDITGYTPEEFMKSDNLWYSMIDDEDKERVSEFLNELHRNKTSSSIEHRIVRKDGVKRWVNNSCTIKKINDDGLLRIDGFILDVTERREREDELRKLSRAIQQSPVSVVITDVNGNIEYVNPKFTRVTGYTFEEVLGKNPRILKSGEKSTDEYRELWETIIAGREWRGDFRNKKKNGELYWEVASISPIRNSRNEITYYVAVKEDITERKKTEEALRISEEQLRMRNELMEKELKYAQMVIGSMLPSKAVINDSIKIDFRYYPLEAVGGDFFTFAHLNNDDYSVFIGDVAGHGVSAALFLTLLRYLTDNIGLQQGYNPSLYLQTLNKILYERMSAYFMTAIYANFTFDENGGATLTFANGGHPPIIIFYKTENRVESNNTKGKLLGVFDNSVYEQKSFSLSKGDRVFVYTDGLIEIINKQYDMLGNEKFLEIIQQCSTDNLADTLDNIFNEVNRFRGGMPVEDDIVLIGCEIR